MASWWREERRTYLEIDSADGPRFARFSTDPLDVAVLEHEVRTRARVGGCPGFSTPEVVASGPGWMLERRVMPVDPGGSDWVDAAVRAATAVASSGVEAMAGGGRQTVGRRLRLLLRTTRSPLRLGDVLAARRLFAASTLPTRMGHGDFHAGNILVEDGMAWLVDWELAGPQPAGYDLMQLWATLPDPHDRDRVFQGAVAWLGGAGHRQLAQLRYVAVVRTLTAKLFPQRNFDHDPEGASMLLALLPEVRRAAGVNHRA